MSGQSLRNRGISQFINANVTYISVDPVIVNHKFGPSDQISQNFRIFRSDHVTTKLRNKTR